MSNNQIRIIVTGGTFDKQYDAIKGDLTFRNTHQPEILRSVGASLDCEIDVGKLIDSLHMTEADRQGICDAACNCEEKQIVITHGTDTMARTAGVIGRVFQKNPETFDKTIVFTGAMVPYAFGTSDALFNLGCALAFAQSLPPGVYIAMNAKAFTWDNVIKNTTLGIFTEINKQ